MKLHRIYGVFLRYLYNFRRSYDRMTDAFYWPTLDLLLWGLTSSYLQQSSGGTVDIVLMLLSGVVFWIIFWRSQYEITVGFLEELWNKNLVNLFVSPLKFSEWVTAWILLGIFKGIISFLFACGLAFILYQTNLFTYGFYMLPFFFVLLLSGWWVGFLITGILMRYGVRIQTLAWSVPWLFAPFAAIYYPVAILPEWAQYISYALPMSYVFEGMREIMATGYLDWNKVYIATALNIIYIVLALAFMKKGFNRILKIGVTKIY